jgi:hypothetical protein
MNNNNYTFITYLLLVILIFVIFSLSFKYKFKSAQKLSFRSLTNKNSNATTKENFSVNNIKGGGGFKEGFKEGLNGSDYNKKASDDIFRMIDNKLKGLSLELGGPEGKAETKKILTNTKKICDLECAKCMMVMLNDKKSINSINIEGVLDDETDENCIRCKKYSALSTSITSIINNL